MLLKNKECKGKGFGGIAKASQGFLLMMLKNGFISIISIYRFSGNPTPYNRLKDSIPAYFHPNDTVAVPDKPHFYLPNIVSRSIMGIFCPPAHKQAGCLYSATRNDRFL